MFQRECCVRRENGSDVGFGRGGEGLLRWLGSREGNLAVFGLVSKVVGFANRKVHMNIRHNWRSRSSHIPQLAPHPLRQHADQHIGTGARHQHRISMLPTFKYKPPTANATTPVTKVPHFQQILIKAVVMPWVVRSSMGGWSSIVTATGRKGGEGRVRLEGTPQRPIFDHQKIRGQPKQLWTTTLEPLGGFLAFFATSTSQAIQLLSTIRTR